MKKCSFNYYFDASNKYTCTENDSCPSNYKIIKEKKKCVKECSDDIDEKYIYELSGVCLEKCPNKLKTDLETKKCLESCDENKYEYENTCFIECPQGTFPFLLDRNVCIFSTTVHSKCNKEKCSTCSIESLNHDLCVECSENKNYYPKLNDPNNFGTYIDCHKNLKKYFLNGNIYEPCYESCLQCYKNKVDKFHNCKTCDIGYNFIIEYSGSNFNCYQNCTFYHYFDYVKTKYYWTKKKKCPDKFSKLIPYTNECISNCTIYDEYRYEFRNQCLKNCPIYTENINYFCKIICTKEFPFEIVKIQQCVSNCTINEFENNICIINYVNNETNENVDNDFVNNIKRDLINGYNSSKIDEGKDVVLQQKNSKVKIIISSTENQKNNENVKNITSINLGECETKLKEHYKIPKDKYLYILRIDVPQEGIDLVKIEYEVYYPLNGKNLEQLDLNYCGKSKVDIFIPYEITDDINKLNISSDYYNDICYTYTSDNGTDIILKDRQQEYIKKNKIVCEENCVFSRYNENTGKAVCSCEIKIKLPLISEIKLDKNKLFDSFTDIKNIANINIMKCYKVFFSIKGISYNYGCYIIIPIFIIHIICNFVFYLKYFKEIKTNINNIVFAKKNFPKLNKLYKENEKEKEKKIILSRRNTVGEKQLKNNKKSYKKLSGIFKHFYKPPLFAKYLKKKNQIKIDKRKNQPPTIIKPKDRKYENNKIKIMNKFDDKKVMTSNPGSNNILKRVSKSSLNIVKKYEFCKHILELNDYELNNLQYKEALKNDKRTYSSYYLSLIKLKHLLIFSFFPMKDYNSRVLKIDLFFINFTIYYTVNAFFFSDKTMHKIYLDSGDYNIIYQLPQILYSSLISGIIKAFLTFLSLTGNNIIQLKHIKSNLDSQVDKTIDLLKKKLLLFFIISYILLLMFWYYVGCFCAIYRNTQIHLIILLWVLDYLLYILFLYI